MSWISKTGAWPTEDMQACCNGRSGGPPPENFENACVSDAFSWYLRGELLLFSGVKYIFFISWQKNHYCGQKRGSVRPSRPHWIRHCKEGNQWLDLEVTCFPSYFAKFLIDLINSVHRKRTTAFTNFSFSCILSRYTIPKHSRSNPLHVNEPRQHSVSVECSVSV